MSEISKFLKSLPKTHVRGTNNRTFCGHEINAKTLLLEDGVKRYRTDCLNCLSRLLECRDFVKECVLELREIQCVKDKKEISEGLRNYFLRG